MEINIDFLERLSIYRLREVAKSCGVKSPTTKKRKELLSEIRDIKNGNLKPDYSVRGRPRINDEQILRNNQAANLDKLLKIDKLLNDYRKELIKILEQVEMLINKEKEELLEILTENV